MLKDNKKIHDAGCALLLLKEKSKLPIGFDWTKKPRASFEELKRDYRGKMNVGVRLGRVSNIGGKFLAVIDCDVKGTDPRFQVEMLKKLAETFGNVFEKAPRVASGRGNGSSHFYVLTESPAVPQRVTQSAEKVEVLMPSVKPSKIEIETMKPDRLKAGYRIRAAWEISIMGEGQQVVLPPSIHPDSGKPYVWVRPFVVEMPVIKPEGVGKQRAKTERLESFTPVEVDLFEKRLSSEIIDLILSGKDCADRSAALFSACIAMVKASMTDEEILSVLTDRDNYLGEAAYDHAQTGNRARAANWVKRYTLEKIKAEYAHEVNFDAGAEITETPRLDEKGADEQKAELEALVHWTAKLERTQDAESRPKASVKNAVLIIGNCLGKSPVKRNQFTTWDEWTIDFPGWGAKVGKAPTDDNLIQMKVWLVQNYRVEFGTDKIFEAVKSLALDNAYHPVKIFLNSLEWDGKPRIDTWLKKYLGAEAKEPYLSEISRKFLVAMIARIMEPGIKFDHVLILEGAQGVGKSTTGRILAGDEWFTDSHINIGDKDAVLSMQAVWVVELGELGGMRRAESEMLKEFISRSVDRVRLPYGRITQEFPRQCVFLGTTNSDEYLKDVSGNRRFWPVKVRQLDAAAFRRDRNQLLAEAFAIYGLGENLYLDNEESETQAREEQAGRVLSDSWTDNIGAFLESKPENFPVDAFSMREVFSDFGPLAGVKDGRGEQMRAAECLKQLNYEKVRMYKNGVLGRYWKKKP